jgi:predicted TIM-barrel fold metal-dependent hydrolase
MQTDKHFHTIPVVMAAAAMALIAPIAAQADDAPIGDDIRSVPIFDAHIHYKKPAWGPYPPETVIEMMDRSGVAMGLVSSTPDAGTITLWEHAPQRIVPELRPYHGDAGSSNWMGATGMVDYLRDRLEKYPHEGIGEFHIRRIDAADEPLLREVVAMAKDRNIPVHVHSGAAPVRLLYRLEPALTVIWAHAGMSEPAALVEEMMAEYATLYADTSFREREILDGNGIDPDWRRLIERFPERFMVGTDTWVNGQWANYASLISLNRQWLGHFPRRIAEMIAFGNAERLFNRKIGAELIGQR